MTEAHLLPPGLVLWPAGGVDSNRVCVLISDIHCTDNTVGDQTADESDWQAFFEQIPVLCRQSACAPGEALGEQIDELFLILNGDVADLIRSSRWAEAEVFPWERNDPNFAPLAIRIMQNIAEIHASPPGPNVDQRHSGFFYWLQRTAASLRAQGIKVSIIPIVGNHDKELQVVDEARRIFYEACLGIKAAEIDADYRQWVSAQLNLPDEPYPRLPVYFADRDFRLFATHGQWRDNQNIAASPGWSPAQGWQPEQWQREGYLPFALPCFGDTVATGLLSRFIWVTKAIVPGNSHAEQRIRNILDEMDLYRPSVKGVLRLLDEARNLARQNPKVGPLRRRIIDLFSESLSAWLHHHATWERAPGVVRVGLVVLNVLHQLGSHTIDVWLMRLMAWLQEPKDDISTSALLALPGFQPGYRELGFRLHVEGHTHVALEADLQFTEPPTRRNYTYINLGTWRDRIVPKRIKGFRRRGIGRALSIFSLGRQNPEQPKERFRFETHDVTSWGDRQDEW